MKYPNLEKKSFFGAAFGTMIEYYDNALFAIFLPLIAPLLFPAQTLAQSLLKGYYILFIANLARPLGGLFFGYLGDVLGRRKALLTSMYGIALATFVIGITPSYAACGIGTIVIIMIAKSIQLFCFGGEYNGAGIYIVEHARNQGEGLKGSLLTSTTLIGSILASLFGIVLTLPHMPLWSWRLAFMLGGIIGIVGIIYRKNLFESPYFKPADLRFHGLKSMLKKYPHELLAGICIGALATVPFITVLAFINPMLLAKGLISKQQLMWLQTFYSLLAVLVLILAGAIADRKTPRKTMQWSCTGFVILSFPLFYLVDQGILFITITALTLLIILAELFLGPSNAYLKNLFNMEFRYRASSLSFCAGMSVMGGLTPIVENYLYRITGNFKIIALWIILIAGLNYIFLYWVHRKRTMKLAELGSINNLQEI